MAERRMFAKSIVLSDAFLDMPMSARCLYFTLGMLADDDGFVGNPKAIMRQCGASQDDLQILFAKKYVLGFESGVIVIKHWRINNFLRNDRHHSTAYVEEKNNLDVDEKGCYFETEKQHLLEFGIPTDNQVGDKRYTEVRLGKVIKEKVDITKVISPQKKSFTRPTYEEVKLYCDERKNCVDAQAFIDFYESKGWKVGNTPMKDWKAAVRTWEHKENRKNSPVRHKDYSDVKPEDLDTSDFSWEA